MRRVLVTLLALVPLTLAALGLSDAREPGVPAPPPPPGSARGAATVAEPEAMPSQTTPGRLYVSGLLDGASAQVQQGAHVYHLVCEACHGASGLGLAEGRLSFPASHQYCERCHHAYNSALWDETAIGPHNSFDLGQPPALRGQRTLNDLPNGLALYAYVRGTMPRYRPGNLSDTDYLAVTAFVLALRGELPSASTLSETSAADVALRPPGSPPP